MNLSLISKSWTYILVVSRLVESLIPNDDDEVTDEVEELEEEMLDLAAARTATLDIATR